MLGKRQQWIPYTSFNPTTSLPLLRAWNVRVNSDPRAREDSYKTAPHNAPDRPAMREVVTMIFRQRTVVHGRDGASINICTTNQVVGKDEEQHCEGMVQKGTGNCNTFYRKGHIGALNARYRRSSASFRVCSRQGRFGLTTLQGRCG